MDRRALAMLNQKLDTESQSVVQDVAERFAKIDPKKSLLFAEKAAAQSHGLNQPDRTRAMARAGAVLIELGRADAGRKLIDEAARDAAKLPTANWAGNCRSAAARILAPYDVERALALVEPFQAANENWWQGNRVSIATAIAKTDTARALALIDAVGGRGFDHYLARTEIAYKIGADRPDEAIKIIEGMRRDRWTAQWQAAAFGWLAVALAPRDRARAFGLIDRALAMMIDNRNAMWRDDEMAVAARIAICARRIHYPDMEGAIMRVMATRSVGHSRFDSEYLMRTAAQAAVALALIDPRTARTVLDEIEARSGLDPTKVRDVYEPWLIAWALVDLKRAEALFEAGLAALEGAKEIDLWNSGFFQMVEFLTIPPHRREEVAGRAFVWGILVAGLSALIPLRP